MKLCHPAFHVIAVTFEALSIHGLIPTCLRSLAVLGCDAMRTAMNEGMTRKLTYDGLVERVKELETEVTSLQQRLDRFAKDRTRHAEVEKMALLGHWEMDLRNNTLHWSDEIFRIFELSPTAFGETYDAFLHRVHPNDRSIVNETYLNSVKNHTGYDLVHRLLLEKGKVKYVHERCKTEYADDGTPIRSLGTVQDITARRRKDTHFGGMIGRDPAMVEVFETIEDLSPVDVPVLIQGESGTGKELVAQAIHQNSTRARNPFVPINCGALPEGVLESELFGHVKGAFTGAIRDKKGRFELADGGTLFLDEVADLPRPVQVKLLRVLQDGAFERVGGEETISVDVRIVSAANRDLSTEVQEGRFRDDLFYRIKVLPIFLPALRERRSDIPLLVQHFVEKASDEGYRTEGISDDAIADMMDYEWPGNIRELQSAIHYALIKAKGAFIGPEHLPREITASKRRRSTPPEAPKPCSPKEDFVYLSRNRDSKLTTGSVKDALNACDGNKLRAAKQLGVGRATLYRFLKENPI
jgi:sigma-54 dependent transcriptional regulator, acetoin dehydrogenase operon transcriptional activator AcoR